MKKGVQHDGPRKPSSVAAGNNADWLEALRHLFKSHEDQKATMVSFLNLTNDDHDDIVQRRPTVDSRSSVDSKDLGWMDYLGSPSTEQAAGSEIWEHLESIVDDDIDDNSHDEGIEEIEESSEDKIHGAIEIKEKVGDQQIGAFVKPIDYSYASALKMVTKTTQKTQENGLLWTVAFKDLDLNAKPGTAVVSEPFEASGYHWMLKIYPNGDVGENKSFLSVSLSVPEDPSAVVNMGSTTLSLSILTSDAFNGPSFIPTGATFHFQNSHEECTMPRFLSHSNVRFLRAAHNPKDRTALQLSAEIKVNAVNSVGSRDLCASMHTTSIAHSLINEAGTEHLFMDISIFRHGNLRQSQFGLSPNFQNYAAITLKVKKFTSFKHFRNMVADEMDVPESQQMWLNWTHSVHNGFTTHVPSTVLCESWDETPMCHFRDWRSKSEKWTLKLDLMLVEGNSDLWTPQAFRAPSTFKSQALLLFWKKTLVSEFSPQYVGYTAVPANIRLSSAYRILLSEKANRGRSFRDDTTLYLPDEPSKMWIEKPGVSVPAKHLNMEKDCLSQGLKTGTIVVVS